MEKIKVNCTYCNSVIERAQWQIRQHEQNNYKDFYCNIKCQTAQRQKEIIENFEKTGLIKCSSCKEEKDSSEFSKGKYTLLGFQRKCKSCYKKFYNKRKKEIDESINSM